MTHSADYDAPRYGVGALPPFSVSYIDPKVCATKTDQWFVMGTVDGDPGNGCGPVAICEYEPSAYAIAALLNATVLHDHIVTMPDEMRAETLRDAADTIERVAKGRVTRFLWRGPIQWLRGNADTYVTAPEVP